MKQLSRSFKKDLLVFSVVFGILTLPFLFTNLDIFLQRPFYSVTQGWFLMNEPFWDFIYKYGIFLGYFLAIGALILVSLTYWKKSLLIWRKAAWFMLFVMVVGPGVLVNGTFKDHWGRPRPREIIEFGGEENYVSVWVKADTPGKSFPCGHASMGFYIAIPFLFLRSRYKTWAWIFFVFGTLYGGLIGYARMVAGGHFGSDVVWAAGMVWFTAIIGFHLFKIEKPIDSSQWESGEQMKKGKRVSLLLGLLIPTLTVSLLLATPYISKQHFSKSFSDLKTISPKVIKSVFTEGTIHLGIDTIYQVNFAVNGFGFPNSKIRWRWNESDTCSYYLERLGWFTEVRNNIQMMVPNSNSWENQVYLRKGKIYLTVPSDSIPFNLLVAVEKGDVFVTMGSNTDISFSIESPEIQNERTFELNASESSPSKIKITVKEGKVVFQ
ncbi:MAG: phosphatase PAP2 family protein [Salinivirgaceae bacterium]